MKRTIRLRGMNGSAKGRIWESTELLRIGRLEPLEIVLDDSSVSRYHAEVRATERGWRIKDLGSTNGTRLNGVRLGPGSQWPLRLKDMLQCGEMALVVESLIEDEIDQDPIGRGDSRIDAMSASSWDEAIDTALDANRNPRPGEHLKALLRASHNLMHIEKEEDLLNSILEDAVKVLAAQRGAIILVDGDQKLKPRAWATGWNEPRSLATGNGDSGRRFQFSQSLARRCVEKGESILCQVNEDPELALAKSIADGAMASVLCVLLRTPRKRLGVLHLDRNPLQKQFTRDDLHLADALAANVSVGIECAQLLRKQRELLLNFINMLAQAIELRDEYTGGHTQRVTTYSLLLAEHLGMDEKDLERIKIGTPLHDIGKIGIEDSILRKQDKLTPEEFEKMKLHTVFGAEIVNEEPDFRPLLPIVRHHHERWDGKGYPDNLAGEEISPLARVVALADAFDAMTSDRPYRKGMPPEAAFAEIEKGMGKQFDPRFAAGFLSIRELILKEMRAAAAKNTPTKKTRVMSGV